MPTTSQSDTNEVVIRGSALFKSIKDKFLRVNHFSALPDEILLNILKSLTDSELIRVAGVSHKFRKLVYEELSTRCSQHFWFHILPLSSKIDFFNLKIDDEKLTDFIPHILKNLESVVSRYPLIIHNHFLMLERDVLRILISYLNYSNDNLREWSISCKQIVEWLDIMKSNTSSAIEDHSVWLLESIFLLSELRINSFDQRIWLRIFNDLPRVRKFNLFMNFAHFWEFENAKNIAQCFLSDEDGVINPMAQTLLDNSFRLDDLKIILRRIKLAHIMPHYERFLLVPDQQILDHNLVEAMSFSPDMWRRMRSRLYINNIMHGNFINSVIGNHHFLLGNFNLIIDRKSSLMHAIEMGFLDLIPILLSTNENINFQYYDDGNTALILAVKKNYFCVAEELLSAGADPFLKNKHGMNALQYAKKNNPKNNNLINLLENAAAIEKAKTLNEMLVIYKRNPSSVLAACLMRAFLRKEGSGMSELLLPKRLLQFQLTRKSILNELLMNFRSLIHFSKYIDLETLKERASLFISNERYLMALEYAETKKSVLQILYQARLMEAFPNKVNVIENIAILNNESRFLHNNTSLKKKFIVSINNENIDDMIRLLVGGIDPDAVLDNFGNSPLHLAVKLRRLKISRALLVMNANVNAKNNDGVSVLNIAVNNKDREMILLLLSVGVNLDASTFSILKRSDFKDVKIDSLIKSIEKIDKTKNLHDAISEFSHNRNPVLIERFVRDQLRKNGNSIMAESVNPVLPKAIFQNLLIESKKQKDILALDLLCLFMHYLDKETFESSGSLISSNGGLLDVLPDSKTQSLLMSNRVTSESAKQAQPITARTNRDIFHGL